MLNLKQEVLSKCKLCLQSCHLCSNVSQIFGSPAAKVLTANKVLQRVALAQSAGERWPNWRKGDAIFTPCFLQSLVKGCPWGPLHSQALLAKWALQPAGEAGFQQRCMWWLGGGKHTRDCIKMVKRSKGCKWYVHQFPPTFFLCLLILFVSFVVCLSTEHYKIYQNVISTREEIFPPFGH